jgi:periplasmic divalent cation tolerance protein
MPNESFVVFSTFPDAETARRIARELVTEKLAACANILPPVESIYHWQGQLDQSAEVLVVFKTTAERYAAMEAQLKQLHPYEVPEIIALPISAGSESYLRWIEDSCR